MDEVLSNPYVLTVCGIVLEVILRRFVPTKWASILQLTFGTISKVSEFILKAADKAVKNKDSIQQ